MEYPDSPLTHSYRLLLLCLFILAFFIIAPLVILYTAGYRYDWQNGILKETGSISIDEITPKNVKATINGLPLRDALPIRLKNITPGKYQITLSAPGYYNWQKEVEVKNKQTVYLKEIMLIKKQDPKIIDQGIIGDLNLSFDGRYLVYTKLNQSVFEVWLLDNTTESKKHLADWPAKTSPALTWSPKSYYLAISGSKPPFNPLYIADAGGDSSPVNLSAKNKPILKYQWQNASTPNLFYSTASNIVSWLPATNQKEIIAPNKFLDWRMENNELWTIQINTSTKYPKIVKDSIGLNIDYADLDKSPPLEILLAERGNLLLKTNSTELILITQNKKQFTLTADRAIISPYQNWWLIWSPWEIWTYVEGEKPQLLSRSGEKLITVTPLDAYNTLALVWKSQTTALFPYYLTASRLLDLPINSLAAYPLKRMVYYSEIKNGKGQLWKVSY